MAREAEEVEKKNAVERQPWGAELHQQSKVGVVDVKSAEVVALHAAAKFGVHAAGWPTGEWAFLEHRPAGLVDGQARLHRATFSGAIPESSLQRMAAEAEGQTNHQADDHQQDAERLHAALDQPESQNDGGDGERD